MPVSAFANCGRAAAHVLGSYVPGGDIVPSTSLSSIVGCSHKKTMRACHAAYNAIPGEGMP